MTRIPTDPTLPIESKRSLIALLTSLPDTIKEVVAAEVDLLKTEIVGKLKSLGAGVGILLGAVVILLFMVGVLLTAAVLALAIVLPGWAAALIVAGILLVLAAIVGLIGYRVLKRGLPPVPEKSIESLKKDLHAIQGIGKKGRE